MPPPMSSISTIIVVNDDVPVPGLVEALEQTLQRHFAEIEFILVANGTASSMSKIRELVRRMPDTTCLALNEQLDIDAASLVGMENAVADHVLLIAPARDVVDRLPAVVSAMKAGTDAVFADPEVASSGNLFERIAYRFLSWMTGATLRSAPVRLALLNREAALHLLSRPNAEITLKSRSLGPGFVVEHVECDFLPLDRKSVV